MSEFNLYGDVGFFGLRPQTGPLKERFVMPPFSTWDTRSGEWQDRRRLWLARGIRSELGRTNVTYNVRHFDEYTRNGKKCGSASKLTGASIFDPVLCELAYGWWCRPGGVVLDPFAGGSVRGIVASVLGYKYYGIELRKEQVASNREQINEATRGQYRPRWVTGDAAVHLPNAPQCDFLFSCPPYGNLEKYSDLPDDISNMDYTKFLDRYTNIIRLAVGKLRENSFACFVVANYRAKEVGRQMINFVGDTISAFEDAGAQFYNDVVLINSVGTGSIRANTNFVRGARKVVKLHQNVLVFCKGSPQVAAESIPASAGVNTGEGQ